VAVPDAHLLLAVGRAGARIYIEHDGSGWVTDINNWLDEARADVQAFLATWPRATLSEARKYVNYIPNPDQYLDRLLQADAESSALAVSAWV